MAEPAGIHRVETRLLGQVERRGERANGQQPRSGSVSRVLLTVLTAVADHDVPKGPEGRDQPISTTYEEWSRGDLNP